jgi:serine/threonine-protein kinase
MISGGSALSVYTGIVLFNYRLTRELGEGGFGVVYEAIHEQLGRRAAVKILHPAFARHDEVVARFFREAQAACAVGHRAIVDITNYGRLDTGEPFIMMDFVAGRALSALTAQDGPLPLERVIDVFGPVASALSAAHGKGVIHRDLKPDNIMVALEDGAVADVKLLDFGIAKLTDAKANDVSTRAGSVMGTPNYMAPEQATDAKAVDARADVYSFAATVYAALTGRPPFEAESTTTLLLLVTTRPAPRLRAGRPDAPQALDDAIAACLEKDPSLRPPTIEAAWRSIKAALGGPTSAAHVAMPAPSASSSLPVAAASAHQTTLSSASGEPNVAGVGRRRWLGAAIAAAGIIGIVVGLVALSGGRGGGARVAAGERAIDAALTDIDAPSIDVDAAAEEESAPLPIDAGVDAVDADVDAGVVVVKREPRPECARGTLERTVKIAAADQRPELRRRVERCAADGALSRRERDRMLAALAEPVVITTPPQIDELVCTKASFSAVYNARGATKEAAQKALRRLAKCEAEKKISTGDASTARSALTAIVLSQ